MESNDTQPQKIDISKIIENNPTPSTTNTVIWSPVWEANLILQGRDDLVGNLYHGAIDSAFDREGLKAHHITHIVHCEFYFKPKFLNEFNYLECSFDDEGGKDLFYVIEKAIPFIKKGIQKGNVLVHCAAGISRSSSIVMAYLLSERRNDINVVTVEDCKQFLRSKRSIAEPQIGYIRCLREFQQSEYNLQSQIILDSLGKTQRPDITLHRKSKSKKILGMF
jgi:protein-tyrosine phosphatase